MYGQVWILEYLWHIIIWLMHDNEALTGYLVTPSLYTCTILTRVIPIVEAKRLHSKSSSEVISHNDCLKLQPLAPVSSGEHHICRETIVVSVYSTTGMCKQAIDLELRGYIPACSKSNVTASLIPFIRDGIWSLYFSTTCQEVLWSTAKFY